MSTKGSGPSYDEFAADYDRLAPAYGWYPEILFGLCFEYVQPGERLLDIGIGTGLCAASFARLGLRVLGLDASPEMLSICRSKGFAVELRQHDIRATPWPYPDSHFDHAIAFGVLHFLDDLAPIFQETARAVRAGGLFVFMTKAPPTESQPGSSGYSTEVISGVTIFLHHKTYIENLMANCGFENLKSLGLLIGVDHSERRDPYCVFVTRKRNTNG
jgi:predicted TPR repeat methyltransferase